MPVSRPSVAPNGTVCLLEGEFVRITQPNVIHLSPFNNNPSAVGSLVITNQRVVWLLGFEGLCYDFKFISMHAIASESFDRPCIYCHLDTNDLNEIHFIPEDASCLPAVYQALCQGAEDNPDPEAEEPVDAWLASNFSDEEMENGEEIEEYVDGQYDDAEEDGE